MPTVKKVQAPIGSGGSKRKPPKKRPTPPPAPPPPPPPPPSGSPPSSGSYTPPSGSDSQERARDRARDRAKERREKRQERRERVENFRGRNEELRMRRIRSRLMSVENSLLGDPIGFEDALPQYLGEAYYRGSNQSIANNTNTTVQFGTSQITIDKLGHSPVYDTSTNLWTVPSGLSGVWEMKGVARFTGDATGRRAARVLLNGSDTIFEMYLSADSTVDQSVWWDVDYYLDEGEYVEFQVFQNSGGALNLLGGESISHAHMVFKGAVG